MENSFTARPRSLQNFLFISTAVFCVAMPGSASIKAVAIIAMWLYTLGTGMLRIRSILWFASVLLNVIFCSEVAFFHNVPTGDTSNQLTRIIIFFLILGLGATVAQSESFDRKTTDRLILWIALISAALKIVILVAVVSGWMSLDSVQNRLGFATVTDNIGFGLQRLQFPSDVILIFLVACYSGGRSRLTDLLFLVCVTASTFLSFSRYLFAAYLVCLAIRYFRIRRLDTVSLSALVVTVALAAVFSVSLATRYIGAGSQSSDSIRTDQFILIGRTILQHPLLGTGIGSSVNGFKRNDNLAFSYEVEWYALAMQFGAIGLVWFLVNLIAPLSFCVTSSRRRGIFLAVFTVWVASGFTNPFIVSVGSAFGLSILMIVTTREGRLHSAHALAPR